MTDSVDLDGLTWQRGGYRVEDLDAVYTGNDVRASLVMQKVHDTLLDPGRARGLGFCVSVAHAEFMARYFSEHGMPALALSGESSAEDRRTARSRLIGREINLIFVVDLYNEGIDIPEIDTVLLLRPTESLTVYLQQLGRGLRLQDEKECLTVLDFIGAQHKQFRLASRYRALSTDPTGRLEQEIEAGFPHLPAGCAIRLERVAQQRVLDNVRQSLTLRRPQIIGDIKTLGRHLGRAPTLRETLDYIDASLEDLLKRGLWSRLLSESGFIDMPECDDEKQLAKGLLRLSHIDDPQQIRFILSHLKQGSLDDQLADSRLTMLYVSLWGNDGIEMSLKAAGARLRANPQALEDVCAVLKYKLDHTRTRAKEPIPDLAGPLAIHAQYTRDEVLVGLSHWDLGNRPSFREGVLHIAQRKIDALFITLHKTAEAYSPTTMYEDYAISDRLFHWQSQSTASSDSPTGQRYLQHREMGYTPLLFVREYKKLPSGLSAPYAFLGPADYVSHRGSRPISITWQLRTPMPVRLTKLTVG